MINKNLDNYSEGVKKCVEMGEKIIAERKRAIEEAKKWRFDTIAVRGLYTVKEAIENNQGSIIEPLYLSTAQAYRNSDELEAALAYIMPAWAYTRITNPTLYYLEWTLALLDGYNTNLETSCLVTSSGMSAIRSAVEPFLVKTKKSPEKINFVSMTQIYGGTFQQFSVRWGQERGIKPKWVTEPGDIDDWADKIDDNTRFLYGELPSNPQQAFFDIKEVAKIAHEHGIPLIVDSTIATPALLRPLEHGADIVVHSTTKSMTASGFGIGGALISKKKHNNEYRKSGDEGRFCHLCEIPTF